MVSVNQRLQTLDNSLGLVIYMNYALPVLSTSYFEMKLPIPNDSEAARSSESGALDHITTSDCFTPTNLDYIGQGSLMMGLDDSRALISRSECPLVWSKVPLQSWYVAALMITPYNRSTIDSRD